MMGLSQHPEKVGGAACAQMLMYAHRVIVVVQTFKKTFW